MSDELSKELAVVRDEIDGIDAQLLDLLNRRAGCAKKVGEIKARHGDAGFIYRPEREAQVLRRIQDMNPELAKNLGMEQAEGALVGTIAKGSPAEAAGVKAGDVILELDDYDPNFMAPDLLNLLEQRKQALEDTRKAALSRADQLDKRIKEMQNLVKAAVPSAGARVLEAESKVREARQKIEASKIAVATGLTQHASRVEEPRTADQAARQRLRSLLAHQLGKAGPHVGCVARHGARSPEARVRHEAEVPHVVGARGEPLAREEVGELERGPLERAERGKLFRRGSHPGVLARRPGGVL